MTFLKRLDTVCNSIPQTAKKLKLFATVSLALAVSVNGAAAASPTTISNPIVFWNTGFSVGSSPEAIIADMNAETASQYAACGASTPPAGQAKSCDIDTFKLGKPHPVSSPNWVTVNGAWAVYEILYDWYGYTIWPDGTTSTRASFDNYNTAATAQFYCPADMNTSQVSNGTDVVITCVKTETPPLMCPAAGAPGSAGNPIQIYNRIKTDSYIDYATDDGVLSIERKFLGQFLGWRMPGEISVVDLVTQNQVSANFKYLLATTKWNGSSHAPTTIALTTNYVRSDSGQVFKVINDDGTLATFAVNPDGTFLPGPGGESIELLASPTGEGAIWRRKHPDSVIEEYGTDGRLRKKQLRGGMAVVYQYSNGQLTSMSDNKGRQIHLFYNPDGLLDNVTLPDTSSITYTYQNGLLTAVNYPDGTSRQYLYKEPAYIASTSPAQFALTGIIDENGKRIGTYRYDNSSLAISTESAGGVNKYTVQPVPGGMSVTSPLGTTNVINFAQVNGRSGVSAQSQPAGAGCSASASSFTYDANGNVASRTDFNGNVTTYVYDLARNLETSRVEAAGTAQARTITTQWHPTLHLPSAIAEPKRISNFTYDNAGNLLTKTEQATSDANGVAGFSASVTGTPRTWTYTYNALGQTLTTKGPRTDVNDTTIYAYDTSNNLISVTNAAGHITSYSNYDANGRVGRITDPNGQTTDFTYNWRGKPTSKNSGGEVTNYSYDGVGQLTKVTMPNGSSLNYIYDDAHRITSVTDNLGNSIVYTLDAMGNRIAEQVKDPSGTLARQTTRVYDALSRLQQITGGQQ